MASIQESMNQLLYTATIGAGLYARSPQGKANVAKKDFEKAEKAYLKASEEAPAEGEDPQLAAASVAVEKSAQKLAELKPTKENIRAAYAYKGAAQDYEDTLEQERAKKYEQKALQNLILNTEGYANMRQAFQHRKEFIKQKGGKE